jgi:hypothetical protein
MNSTISDKVIKMSQRSSPLRSHLYYGMAGQ